MYDYGNYLFYVFPYEKSNKIPLNFNDNVNVCCEVYCDMRQSDYFYIHLSEFWKKMVCFSKYYKQMSLPIYSNHSGSSIRFNGFKYTLE